MEYINAKGVTYYLHQTTVTLRGGNRQQVIYYFAKVKGDKAIDQVPEGFEIAENTRTGLPCLRRVK